MYIHPLKVWERYSPTMFFPHLIEGENARSITSSADSATLFSKINRSGQNRDYWEITLERANTLLAENIFYGAYQAFVCTPDLGCRSRAATRG